MALGNTQVPIVKKRTRSENLHLKRMINFPGIKPLLIFVLCIFFSWNLSWAGQTHVLVTQGTNFSTDDNRKKGEIDQSSNNSDANTETRANLCSGCAIPNVVITNREFTKGTDCLCIGTESITIGEGVVIQNGARVTFEAPKVYLQNSFKAEKGSTVIIQWDTPPPPPG